ncbi:MAG TPA: D-cysteine desulfhydrase family protein [Pirellulaceae bacterium]|nr:D-cysteine desulfhydrase family protein [Pirellulaceae bacterium]
MNDFDVNRRRVLKRLEAFPRCRLAHLPTPLESMERLSQHLDGVSLFVKRDDCTGLGFGGNKVRQLEFYFGQALKEEADTVLITGAIQSNFVRAAAAAARRLGMECHIQLEERVPGVDALHRSSGNVLLSRILGAKLHSYPAGEDEDGADANLSEIAEQLRQGGSRPYIIPLGAGHDPLGALGYIDAAVELVTQLDRQSLRIDHLVVTSGSGATHAGILFGLRSLGSQIGVTGVCPRRDAQSQRRRIAGYAEKLTDMLGLDPGIEPDDLRLTDVSLAPGYGQLNDETVKALQLTAQCEGLFLDPVYTAKTMAGLFHLVDQQEISGNVVFVHTGGQPALFGYGDALIGQE